ncbi:MAG TPA: phytanoyl-CoA dioxygenase family protein [Pyrinomonadaceae bacterium]|nr:phytanoyl-CoA dioxygenase family protein [Pyrinomonadaceae bacterium]
MPILNDEQLQQYKNDGFLVLKDFVEAHECDALRQRIDELIQEFDPAGVVSIFSTNEQDRIADDYFMSSGDQIRFFFEENAFLPDGTLKQSKERSINKIGHALHDLDPVFNRFSRSEKIEQLAAAIGFTDPRLVQSMYIFKQPNIGGEVSCHQDSTFLYTEPADIVGLWFALEDATIENGCLWAIPGGHKRGLKSRWVRSENGRMEFRTFDAAPWPEDELAPLEVKKGSLILLDGLLPHRSFANRSTRSRHAYTLHLIHADATYSAGNWLQRSAASAFRGF